MTLKFFAILPMFTLSLGACEITTKYLGEPDTDTDATSSSSSDSYGSSDSVSGTGPNNSSSSTTATDSGPETGSSSSSTTATDSGPETSSSTTATATGTSSTSGWETSGGPETGTSSTSGWETSGGPDPSDTDITSTSSTSGWETSGGPIGECDEAPLDAPGVVRACSEDLDCVVVFHQTDCCGTVEAFGINADTVAAYLEAEAPCSMEPICDCVPNPTKAEDGEVPADDQFIVARCVDNQCRSEVAGP